MNAPKPPIKGASETYKQLSSFLQILLLYWAVFTLKKAGVFDYDKFRFRLANQ